MRKLDVEVRNEMSLQPAVVRAPGNLQSAICNLQSEVEPLLLCQRVSKWYGAVIGVNQVTLELRSGITGLVGANGAGTSTLKRLITVHLRPDLGQVTIRGVDAWSSAAKRLVGYCPEVDAFYEELSGRQFVETLARLCGYPWREARRRAEEALERVGMADRADRKLRGYSKGMRQRIKLAQALIDDPPLLVLDEPLSGIDPVGRAEFVALCHELAGQGKCLLISSHELEELEKLTDHVAIMSRGRIAAADTVGRIRDRLANHPLTIRIDLRKSEGPCGATPLSGPDRFRFGHPPGSNGDGRGSRDHRDLAAVLLYTLPDVVGVELLESEPARPEVGRLLVRARNPRRFFAELNRLVLEEWYDVVHLETLDDSTQAVLGYLLGKK
jgi:ABC-2 type transport system ATP-binding protein